jgi:hypothetical protein
MGTVTKNRLSAMGDRTSEPIVEEVLRFEDLPLGSAGTRHAVVRWSDGTEGAALAWYTGRDPRVRGRSWELAVYGARVKKSPQIASSGSDEGYII